jgi:hypothetical protein
MAKSVRLDEYSALPAMQLIQRERLLMLPYQTEVDVPILPAWSACENISCSRPDVMYAEHSVQQVVGHADNFTCLSLKKTNLLCLSLLN